MSDPHPHHFGGTEESVMGKRPKSELSPSLGSVSGIEAEVCADIAARQKRGLEKYGVSVSENPLAIREWLQHAYEEHLDAAIYLRRAIDKLDAAPAAIAEDLFTNGFGVKSERLAMILPGSLSPGGWCKEAVVERVKRHISQNAEVSDGADRKDKS